MLWSIVTIESNESTNTRQEPNLKLGIQERGCEAGVGANLYVCTKEDQTKKQKKSKKTKISR